MGPLGDNELIETCQGATEAQLRTEREGGEAHQLPLGLSHSNQKIRIVQSLTERVGETQGLREIALLFEKGQDADTVG
jgi:hypothetical protein